jgi:hypothetical protein
MAKIGRPARLIAYDTDLNILSRQQGKAARIPPAAHCARRFYVRSIALVGGVMTFTLVTRTAQSISVLHDRNPIFVRLSDGAIRKRLHDTHRQQAIRAAPSSRSALPGLTGLAARLVQTRDDGRFVVDVGPDPDARSARAGHRLSTCRRSTPITSTFTTCTGETRVRGDYFRAPEEDEMNPMTTPRPVTGAWFFCDRVLRFVSLVNAIMIAPRSRPSRRRDASSYQAGLPSGARQRPRARRTSGTGR